MTFANAQRGYFSHDGLRLSYLDTGEPTALPAGDVASGTSPVLLALHGHLNEGRFIDQGGVPEDIGYRIIAPDQRGHGESDHAESYSVSDYVGDALALLDHLGIQKASVLGHSLGGVVGYTLAARIPDRVPSLVVVDIGAEVSGDLSITASWPHRAPSRDELVDSFGFMGAKQAFVMREYPDGWGVPWDAADMVRSQLQLNGDHWDDWVGTSMPALLVHGSQSRELSLEQAEEMAARRPNTRLETLEGGHAIYVDASLEYAMLVESFLAALRASG